MSDALEERGTSLSQIWSGKWLSLSLLRDPHLDDSSPPFFTIHPSADLNIPFSGMQNQPDPTHVLPSLDILGLKNLY